MASESTEVYDLLILVDATYSMGNYLKSLHTSLPQIIRISTLTDCFSQIGILAYRDYCDKGLLDWSGWVRPSEVSDDGSEKDLVAKAKSFSVGGGGDFPEATKTGLVRAYEVMRADANTIIILFTDAPPHTASNGSLKDFRNSWYMPEQEALLKKDSYGGYGPQFADWVSAANMLASGEKRAQVFSILEAGTEFKIAGYYTYLSAMTNGASFQLTNGLPASISDVTVNVLLSWMGAEKPGSAQAGSLPAYLSRYDDEYGKRGLGDEESTVASNFFFASEVSSYDCTLTEWDRGRLKGAESNMKKITALSDILKYLPRKKTPVMNFPKRYATDPAYKQLAVKQLRKIINEDVSIISLNPVFGSLWRAICNDRDDPTRDELVTVFGSKVDSIQNASEKARMKTWLEESYDYTAEVMDNINSVPDSERFPCVCLDPTLSFTLEADGEDEEAKPITAFRRDELLEIWKIL